MMAAVPDRRVYRRLVLAIDQTEVTDVLSLGHEVLARAGCVKISSHLVQRMPPGRAFDFVRNHRARAIFYDARFVDDRPDNLAADIRVVCGEDRPRAVPPELVSVHYAVGFKAMRRAVGAAEGRTEVVVFLSSSNWSVDDYRTMHDAAPEDMVRRYARIAAEAGVRTVMCAAIDAHVIKEDPATQHLSVYGTGVRFATDPGGEQQRIIPPTDALAAGVDFVVVGSPIVQSSHPEEALARYGAVLRDPATR
jgi:orotidine-5'-phosphate decarboxylase